MSPPQACTLEFVGTRVGGGEQVSQTCVYSGSLAKPAMQKFSFPDSFEELVDVTIVLAGTATLPATTIVQLDDVTGVTWSK